MEIDNKYRTVLLEAMEELMYKTSMELEAFKGQPMTPRRKTLTQKQKEIEELQHLISNFGKR